MQDNNKLLRVTLYRNIDNSVDWFEPFTITEDDLLDIIKKYEQLYTDGVHTVLNPRIHPYSYRTLAIAILTKLKGNGISNSPL
jgi:hypothetical protein